MFYLHLKVAMHKQNIENPCPELLENFCNTQISKFFVQFSLINVHILMKSESVRQKGAHPLMPKPAFIMSSSSRRCFNEVGMSENTKYSNERKHKCYGHCKNLIYLYWEMRNYVQCLTFKLDPLSPHLRMYCTDCLHGPQNNA